MHRRPLSLTELDHQYNCRATVRDAASYTDAWESRSAAARARLRGILNVPYGPSVDEVLDVFPANVSRAPILVFVHGGYWRAHTKDGSSHVASGFAPSGICSVIVNHSLAPAAQLDAIVEQIRRSFRWVRRNATSFGADPRRIHVAGQSSGAHLAAMLLVTDWGSVDYPIQGAALLSGLYDLGPLRSSFVNEWLQLDEAAAARNSPIHCIPRVSAPVIVGVAGADTSEFRRQSRTFLAQWRAAGNRGSLLDVRAANHYSILDEMVDAESRLGRAVRRQILHAR
jgi:arylformamidase